MGTRVVYDIRLLKTLYGAIKLIADKKQSSEAHKSHQLS